MNSANKMKYLKAVPDIDAAIKAHGFDAVRWVVGKRTQQNALRRRLALEQKRGNDRIAEIKRKLSN